jgi:hypothetical protein
MAMVAKTLGAAAVFMAPMVPVIGQPLNDALIVGSNMHEANQNGENAISAGISSYASAKAFNSAQGMISAAAGTAIKNKIKNDTASGILGAATGMIGGTLLIQGTQIGAKAYIDHTQKTAKTMSQAYNQRGKFGSGLFAMTQAGYTMRQRSLNAIRQNGINLNSALGNEARNFFLGG